MIAFAFHASSQLNEQCFWCKRYKQQAFALIFVILISTVEVYVKVIHPPKLAITSFTNGKSIRGSVSSLKYTSSSRRREFTLSRNSVYGRRTLYKTNDDAVTQSYQNNNNDTLQQSPFDDDGYASKYRMQEGNMPQNNNITELFVFLSWILFAILTTVICVCFKNHVGRQEAISNAMNRRRASHESEEGGVIKQFDENLIRAMLKHRLEENAKVLEDSHFTNDAQDGTSPHYLEGKLRISRFAGETNLAPECSPTLSAHYSEASLHSSSSNKQDFVTGTCGICLASYEVGDTVVWSPNPECTHAFHDECMILWCLNKMQEHPEIISCTCPFCRYEFIELENLQKQDADV